LLERDLARATGGSFLIYNSRSFLATRREMETVHRGERRRRRRRRISSSYVHRWEGLEVGRIQGEET